MLSLIVLGLTVPGPVVALTLIELLNEPGRPPFNWLYDQTLFAPCAALVVRSGAMATLIVWIALRRLTSVFFELAALDGLSTLRQLWQIALPLTWRAITAAWLAACAVAVGDLSATILVLPPGVDTIALRLFERLHYGAEDQVAAISLLLVLFFAALGFFTLALWNRSLRRPAK
jgi:iron(III) transport system permease protein